MPPPIGELLFGYFPPVGVTLMSGDAPLRLEVEFFVPNRWRDSPIGNWHAQRAEARVPFSIGGPFREWMREESRLLFLPNRFH